MTRTALATAHERLGAQWVEQLGWEVSTHYGNLLAEYQAGHNSVGVIDLSHRGRIEVSGKERGQFLHGLVSNDIKGLKKGEGVFAAFLNATGRILSDCFIYNLEESFLIDTPPSTRERIYKALDRFSPAGDFNVTDLTEATALLTLQGPQAAQLLTNLGTVLPLVELQLTEGVVAGHQLIIIKHSRTTEIGFDLFVSNEHSAAVFEALIQAGAQPVGLDAFNLLRLEAGYPEYGIDMDENIILLEAGLERAVSYTKGCYLGQETIAKIHHRGHGQTAKRLTGLVLKGQTVAPAKGAKVFNQSGKEIGHITSAAYSPKLEQVIALAYLRRDNFTPGQLHNVLSEGGNIAAEVTQCPFLK